jgi:hypothetical protein
MLWTGSILLSFYFLRRIIRICTVLTEWADADSPFRYVIRTFVSLLNNGRLLMTAFVNVRWYSCYTIQLMHYSHIKDREVVLFQKTENFK